MSDIVERARQHIDRAKKTNTKGITATMLEEAADEIERLRKCLRIAKRDMMATDLNRQSRRKAQ